ncbi:GTPase HflX [Candidatus Gracilibacteria bacterium]|nr:GTPase HflX [Candidatus Gracilibacteria bacterium]
MSRQKSQRELEQMQKNLEYHNGELRVFIADVVGPNAQERENLKDRMVELENLVNTYGGVVILEHIQKKSHPDYDTYIGGGKLEDIMHEMELKNANILIIGNILKPAQIYKINEKLRAIGAKAWDRVDLILKIFERHAKSKEAKLQIELAAIGHMGPRIFDMGMELGKQGGKGKGETNTEIMKRHLQRREIAIKKDLEHYAKVRAQHRQSRSRKGLLTVGVVGYTNAGKSTLTNTLTNKGVLAEDKLFATLGTSVGKMWLSGSEMDNYRGQEVLINDTIGFIRNLPPELIEAFTSTLEDSIEADILLHVVDASDPKIEEKIQVVDNILQKIGATQKKLYIFNKIDGIRGKTVEILGENEESITLDYQEYLQQTFSHLHPIFVSAFEKIGLEELKEIIREELGRL